MIFREKVGPKVDPSKFFGPEVDPSKFFRTRDPTQPLLDGVDITVGSVDIKVLVFDTTNRTILHRTM